MIRENPGFTIKVLFNIPGGLKPISEAVPDKFFRAMHTGFFNNLSIPFFDSVLLPIRDQYNTKEYVRVMEQIQRKFRTSIDVSHEVWDFTIKFKDRLAHQRIKDQYYVTQTEYPGIVAIGILANYRGCLRNIVEGIGENFYHTGIKEPDVCFWQNEYGQIPQHFIPIMHVLETQLEEVTEYLPSVYFHYVGKCQLVSSKQGFFKISGFQIERKGWIKQFSIGKEIDRIDRVIN